MQHHSARYLDLLKHELAERLMPAASTSTAQQVSFCSARLLGYLQAEAQQLPVLRTAAVARIRELEPALRDALPAALAGRLRRELDTDDDSIQRLLAEVQESLLSGGHTALARELLLIESEVRQGLRDAFRDNIRFAEPEDDKRATEVWSPTQKQKVRDFIRHAFPGEDTVEIGEVKALEGGFSKQTLFIELRNTKQLPARLVMRRDNTVLVAGTSVSYEYKLIQKVYEAGGKVPKPYAVDDSAEVLGTNFMLVEKVDGEVIGDVIDVKQADREFGLDLARQMAVLHNIAVDGVPEEMTGYGQSTMQRLENEIRGLREQWRAQQRPCALIHAGYVWLLANLDKADGPFAIVHRDIGVHNMLVKDHKLAAFLDWEASALGNPIEDVGYAYFTIRQLVDWHDFVAAYEAAGGPKIEADQLDFYIVKGLVWLYTLIGGAKAAILAGQINDIKLGYICEHLEHTIRQRLSAYMAQMLR